MKTFVTGGSGFVGRELIRTLKERGHQVVAIARSKKSEDAVRTAGATPVQGDLDGVEAMTKGLFGCELIIHCAAHTEEWDTEEAFWRVNVTGTANLIAAARAANVKRLVLVSSESVLADGAPLVDVDETHPYPPRPIIGYPSTKGECERVVLAENRDGLETVIVRPRNIWGRGDTANLVKFAEGIKAGRFAWIDHGRYLTSTTHVANVCDGTILAAERGKSGESYFISDGKPVEFRWWLTEVLKTQGIAPPQRNIPFWAAWSVATTGEAIWRTLRIKRPPPATKVAIALMGQQVTVNDAKARRELGYAPKMTIEEGLLEMARLPAIVGPRAAAKTPVAA